MSKNSIDPTLLAFMEGKTINTDSQMVFEENKKNLPSTSTSQPLVGELILADENKLSEKIDSSRKEYSSIMDKLLKTQRMSDAAEIGDSMNQLISSAKGLDPEKLGKSGLVNKFKTLFGNAKEHFERETDTVLARIDTLSAIVHKNIATQMEVRQDFYILLEENGRAYKNIEKELYEFEMELKKAEEYQKLYQDDESKMFKVKSYIDRLVFFINNIKNNKVDNVIMEKEIQNSLGSITKIMDAIKSSESDLLNSWKMSLNMYLRNQTQKKGLELADSMREALNESMLSRSKINNEVTVGAARLQQSTNTKLETLEILTAKLEDTAKAVKLIEEEGKKGRVIDDSTRKNIENRITQLGRV